MDPMVLSTAAAIGGVALVIWSLAYCLPRRINRLAADEVVLKLLRAGSIERAKKLVAAAGKDTYLSAYGAAIGAAAATASRDPLVVKPATRAAFTAVADDVARRWVSAIMRGIVGGMVGGVGLYVGMRGPGVAPSWVRALAGLAVLGGVWALLRRNDIATALEHGEHDVLPEIDRAFCGAPVESTEE